MSRAAPLTVPLTVGQRAWPSALRRWWQSQRRCGRSVPNVLLLGPPGVVKSMLARRLTTILPAMTLAEAIETTRIHSVAGLTGDRTTLVTTRPCRAPITPSRTRGGSAGATGRCRARGRWRAPGEDGVRDTPAPADQGHVALAVQVCGAAPLFLSYVEAASWPLAPSLMPGYPQTGHAQATYDAA